VVKPLIANPFAACPVLDAATLGALYDNNSDPRNRSDLLALQACSAAAFDSPSLVHRRVQLGQGDTAWVDLFKPLDTTEPLPALVFVHGGRWQFNTSRETMFWAQACTDAGLACVGLNFAPLSHVGLGAQIAEVAQAWHAVVTQAPSLGLDSTALILAGHSSGAHLALAALLHQLAQTPTPTLPRALLLLGGIYDLAPLRATTHQAALGFTETDVTLYSPLQVLHRATAAGKRLPLPPTLVAAGAQESSEFIRQARALHWALQAHTTATWCEVPSTAHFDAAISFNLQDSPLRAFVADALTKEST
jgi:arylformamidase